MYVGNNKVYRKDGTKVMTTDGTHLSINAAWMMVYKPAIKSVTLKDEADMPGVVALLEKRRE